MIINMKKIGSACKIARIQMNMKVKEIADIMGLTAGSISSFENGRANNMKYIVTYMILAKNFDENVYNNLIENLTNAMD